MGGGEIGIFKNNLQPLQLSTRRVYSSKPYICSVLECYECIVDQNIVLVVVRGHKVTSSNYFSLTALLHTSWPEGLQHCSLCQCLYRDTGNWHTILIEKENSPEQISASLAKFRVAGKGMEEWKGKMGGRERSKHKERGYRRDERGTRVGV